MTTCYINGKYKPLSKSFISITDRGFQFSDGVYEVIAIYNDKFVDEILHLNRLKTSLKKLQIKLDLSINQIQNISQKIKKVNSISNGIIYIQVTRGNQSPRDHKYKAKLKPNFIIYSIKKNFKNLDKLAIKGVKTSLYPDIRWLRSDIKSISLLGNVMAANHANKNNCHESILYDHKNNGQSLLQEGDSFHELMLLMDKNHHLRMVLSGNREGHIRRMKQTMALLQKQYDKILLKPEDT